MRKVELLAETERAMRQLELEAKIVFDICKHVALIPAFQDNEVDSYFNVFELDLDCSCFTMAT